jgi:hypothetical protein
VSTFRWYDPMMPYPGDGKTNREIDADRIEFAPGHVVFRDMEHHVILAVSNNRVHELTQVPDAVDRALRDQETLCDAPGVGGSKCVWPPHSPLTPHSWQAVFEDD